MYPQVPEIIGHPVYTESSLKPAASSMRRIGTAKQHTGTPSATNQRASVLIETASDRPSLAPSPPPSPRPTLSLSHSLSTIQIPTSTAPIQDDTSTNVALPPGPGARTSANLTINPSSTFANPDPPLLTSVHPEKEPDLEETTTPKAPSIIIIVIVAGVIGLLAIIGGVYFICRHKRQRRRRAKDLGKKNKGITSPSSSFPSLEKETASGAIDRSRIHPSSSAPVFPDPATDRFAHYCNEQNLHSQQSRISPISPENGASTRNPLLLPPGQRVLPQPAAQRVPSKLTAANLAELNKPIQHIHTASTADIGCRYPINPQANAIYQFPMPPETVPQSTLRHPNQSCTCSNYSEDQHHLQEQISRDVPGSRLGQSECTKPVTSPPMIRYNTTSFSHPPVSQSSATTQPPPPSCCGSYTTCLNANCFCDDDKGCSCSTSGSSMIGSTCSGMDISIKTGRGGYSARELVTAQNTPVAPLEVHKIPPMTLFQREANHTPFSSKNANTHMNTHMNNDARSFQTGAPSNSTFGMSTSTPQGPDPGGSGNIAQSLAVPNQRLWRSSEYSLSEYTDYISEAQFSSSHEPLAVDSYHLGSSTIHHPSHRTSPPPPVSPLPPLSSSSPPPPPRSFQKFNRTIAVRPTSEDYDREPTLTTEHIRQGNSKAGPTSELEKILKKRGFSQGSSVSVEPRSRVSNTSAVSTKISATNARGAPGSPSTNNETPWRNGTSYGTTRRTTSAQGGLDEWE